MKLGTLNHPKKQFVLSMRVINHRDNRTLHRILVTGSKFSVPTSYRLRTLVFNERWNSKETVCARIERVTNYKKVIIPCIVFSLFALYLCYSCKFVSVVRLRPPTALQSPSTFNFRQPQVLCPNQDTISMEFSV